MSNAVKNYRRHMRAYHFFKVLLLPFFRWRYNITTEPAPDIEGPCLVLANHNTDLDPVLIHLSFKELLYFVASEHIFRAGFSSVFLKRYFDPIPRLKGKADIKTVREIMERIKQGRKVCIFAEGNRSFNGLTDTIPSSAGRLAKVSGVPLVTYKFEGGYFTTPRWAYTMRRGRMRGYVVNVYPWEQLKDLSVDEINAMVAADLFEDAYARQGSEKIRFSGNRLAEGLENALYLCPHCEGISTIRSIGNEFSCECGLHGEYDEFGCLKGTPYTTVTDWDLWQKEKLVEITTRLGDEVIFSDEEVTLAKVHPDHSSEIIVSGALTMQGDRILCGEHEFLIQDIRDMSIYGRSTITFSYGSDHYEILSKAPFCGRKYLELYKQQKRRNR